MYLALILVTIFLLVFHDWKTALAIFVVWFCMDRVSDNYRRELEEKKQDKH